MYSSTTNLSAKSPQPLAINVAQASSPVLQFSLQNQQIVDFTKHLGNTASINGIHFTSKLSPAVGVGNNRRAILGAEEGLYFIGITQCHK